jgi:hypothetical protein
MVGEAGFGRRAFCGGRFTRVSRERPVVPKASPTYWVTARNAKLQGGGQPLGNGGQRWALPAGVGT